MNFLSLLEAKRDGATLTNQDLGGGRRTKEESIHPEVGIDSMLKPGAPVRAGAVLCRIHAALASDGDAARQRLEAAFVIDDAPPTATRLIQEVIPSGAEC